jgi:hypothetical protein
MEAVGSRRRWQNDVTGRQIAAVTEPVENMAYFDNCQKRALAAEQTTKADEYEASGINKKSKVSVEYSCDENF